MKTLSILVAAAGLVAAPAFAQGAPNPVRGKTLFLQCSACHAVAAGQPHKVGPNLNGALGAKAGTRPGFAYSKAMASAGFAWDDANLDAFIKKPSAKVPGNKMVFGGVANDVNRRDIIAYLKQATR